VKSKKGIKYLIQRDITSWVTEKDISAILYEQKSELAYFLSVRTPQDLKDLQELIDRPLIIKFQLLQNRNATH
jgi:hypothetical protein